MIAFAALRALGWSRPPPAPIGRLADPLGDAITAGLMGAHLWSFDTRVSLIGDAKAMTVRVFLPEDQQSDRSLGGYRATLVRAVVSDAMRGQGYVIRFTDALFCEKGTKGWAVLAKAVRSIG